MIEDLAFSWILGLSAELEGGGKDALDPAKIAHALVDFLEALLDQLLHFLAGFSCSRTESEKRLHVFKSEAGGLCCSNEPESFEGVMSIDAVIPVRSSLRLEQPDPFVVPNGRRGDICGFGEFTDRRMLTHTSHYGDLEVNFKVTKKRGFSWRWYMIRSGRKYSIIRALRTVPEELSACPL